MATNKLAPFVEFQTPTNIRLSALWTSLMFLYIYADYFNLMAPKKLENMMQLQTPVGPTTPGVLIAFSVLLIVPSLMIILSIFLQPSLNRWLNILFGTIYGLISLLIIGLEFGNEWANFFILYNAVELVIFYQIIRHAIKWPREIT
ncbi:MAG: DUF6326 family protein [Bacteroidota bacterium]